MAGNEAPPVVLIAGVGTVGSVVAETLGRQRPDVTLILVDHDVVQPHNVAKSALYRRSDVGERKVWAAARHLREISGAHVVPIPRRLETLGLGPFRIASGGSIALLDERKSKFAWNRACQAVAVPLALIAELEGGDSLASRLRAFAPGITAEQGPCLECAWGAEDYAVLDHLSLPCSRLQEAGSGEEGVLPTPALFSPALRLAAECVDELGRALTGRPSLAPGEELRMLPEQRHYTVLRTRSKADCLCPHGPPTPQIAVTGTAQTLKVGGLISQADAALGRGWTWHTAEGAERRAGDLAPHANRLLADLCPPGDLLRMTCASGETIWLALPTAGLLAWLESTEMQTP